MDLYRAKEKGGDTWLIGSVLQESDTEMYMLLSGPVAAERPAYNSLGVGCGLEDNGITDRYEAAAYGWETACEAFEENCPTFAVLDPETVCRWTKQAIPDGDSGRYVFEGDILGVSDDCRTVLGIVRYGEYKTPSEREETHLGFFVEWQDDGANMWSEWWRQDLLFWIRRENCKVVGNIFDNADLIDAGEEAGEQGNQPLLMPAT